MEKYFIQIGALIGTGIGILAYWPQINHLIKIKNSIGISIMAWYAWLISNIILLFYAIYINDIVFLITQALFSFLCAWMILLAYKYKKNEI